MIAFGPIPSRRLGQSLGINNIPPKSCTYDCLYCQVGPTHSKDLRRRVFYEPEVVVAAVREKVAQTLDAGGRIDYLTFVPDGEPTLDINLGHMIDLLGTLRLKIAVITNSSLLWKEDVRAELARADCVSLKIDAVTETIWQKINRPSPELSLQAIMDGALTFAHTFRGLLLTETMLVGGVNDSTEELHKTAEFLQQLHPDTAFLAVPTRPPSEPWAVAPDPEKLVEAYRIFTETRMAVELLTGYSPEPYTTGGDAVQSILDITCVHPMRESEALDLLGKAGKDQSALKALVEDGQLLRVTHAGEVFYVRKLSAA